MSTRTPPHRASTTPANSIYIQKTWSPTSAEPNTDIKTPHTTHQLCQRSSLTTVAERHNIDAAHQKPTSTPARTLLLTLHRHHHNTAGDTKPTLPEIETRHSYRSDTAPTALTINLHLHPFQQLIPILHPGKLDLLLPVFAYLLIRVPVLAKQ